MVAEIIKRKKPFEEYKSQKVATFSLLPTK